MTNTGHTEPAHARPLRTDPIPQYMWGSRRANLAAVLLFALMISMPLVGWFFKIQFAVPGENRTLAPRPLFCNGCMPTFPAAFDAYYQDHLGFRWPLIRANAALVHDDLRSSTDTVVIGEAPWPGDPRWLFLASVVDADFLSGGPLPEGQLEAWARVVKRRRDWLRERGIQYLFVIAPEKSSIYPELLPGYIRRRPATGTRTDQLFAWLGRNHADLPVLDLRPVLRRTKSSGEVYFPGDTHWNGRGAFAAYREIFSRLRFPSPVEPQELGRDYKIQLQTDFKNGDLRSLLGEPLDSRYSLVAVASGSTNLMVERATWPGGVDRSLDVRRWTHVVANRGGKGRLLVFNDSFLRMGMYRQDIHPLAASFEHTYFASLYPTSEVLERFVEMERPDVVIEERVERYSDFTPEDALPDLVSPGLPRLSTPPACNIDLINGGGLVSGVEVSGDGSLRFEGWALDDARGSPAYAVEVRIDDNLFHAEYGLDRPDVAEVFHCPACVKSGFRLELHNLVSPGEHSLFLRVISRDGKAYSEAAFGRFRIKR